jgi:hypothetical protein
MDDERDYLPGEHPLSELAHLFNPEQAFLFHHLSDCFFRKARLPRYPIVRISECVRPPEDAAAIFPQQAPATETGDTDHPSAVRPWALTGRALALRTIRRRAFSGGYRLLPQPSMHLRRGAMAHA